MIDIVSERVVHSSTTAHAQMHQSKLRRSESCNVG